MYLCAYMLKSMFYLYIEVINCTYIYIMYICI